MFLEKIDINKKLDAKNHLILHAYHAFINAKPRIELYENLFNFEITERIFFYESLISSFNSMLGTYKEVNFQKYISEIQERDVVNYENIFYLNIWRMEKPVIWSDRNKKEYYLINLTDSHRFQLYVENIFLRENFDIGLYYGRDEQYNGESEAGIEIKFDKKCVETGNLFIETAERLSKEMEFVPSGIFKDDNTKIIAIGNYEFIYFIRKSDLINIYNNISNYKNCRMTGAGIGTSKGFVIPIALADEISLTVKEVIDEIRT